MDNPNLFVNDGSFLLRFKQLQQEKENEGKKEVGASLESSKPAKVVSATKASGTASGKSHVYNKTSDTSKPLQAASGGKLAFSLKQKSKLVPRPAKLGGDEEEEEETNFRMDMASTPMKRQRLGQSDISKHASRQFDIGNDTCQHMGCLLHPLPLFLELASLKVHFYFMLVYLFLWGWGRGGVALYKITLYDSRDSELNYCHPCNLPHSNPMAIVLLDIIVGMHNNYMSR